MQANSSNTESESFVFVSYAHEDQARVAKLIDGLAAKGINIWWDGKIELGSPWRSAIQQHLDEAACTLVVWTTHSVDSSFVRSEASWGESVVPVKLDVEARIPVGFTEYQHCDLTDWDGASTPAFEELVTTLRRFLERGPRLINQWVLEQSNDEISRATEATRDLRGRVGKLRSVGEISALSAQAAQDLRVTLGEVDKTYRALNEAIKKFLAPALAPGELDAAPYLALERDEFRAQVERGRGHCGLISLHYGRTGGLRDRLVELLSSNQLTAEQLREFDQLFVSFAEADLDAFRPMVSIADLLTTQSRAIVNLILGGQTKLARTQIVKSRDALAPLEQELAHAMREMQQARATLGFPGGAQ